MVDLTLASGSWDGTVLLWEVATGREMATLQGCKNWINSVSFSPDGKTLASGSSDGTNLPWDMARYITPPLRPDRTAVEATVLGSTPNRDAEKPLEPARNHPQKTFPRVITAEIIPFGGTSQVTN